MNTRCPHCTNNLMNTMEQEVERKIDENSVHLGGGNYLRQVTVAMVYGECKKHGFVRVEKRILVQGLKSMV